MNRMRRNYNSTVTSTMNSNSNSNMVKESEEKALSCIKKSLAIREPDNQLGLRQFYESKLSYLTEAKMHLEKEIENLESGYTEFKNFYNGTNSSIGASVKKVIKSNGGKRKTRKSRK